MLTVGDSAHREREVGNLSNFRSHQRKKHAHDSTMAFMSTRMGIYKNAVVPEVFLYQQVLQRSSQYHILAATQHTYTNPTSLGVTQTPKINCIFIYFSTSYSSIRSSILQRKYTRLEYLRYVWRCSPRSHRFSFWSLGNLPICIR